MNNHILVVDDDPNIAHLIRLYLEKEGWSVIIAHRGDEALAALSKREFALVLLDIMLPHGDGMYVLSKLRETMVQVYRQMYAKEPQVVAIHAGLECGLLSEKLPGLDCVSIGPDMQDIHTSRERLHIASTRRTWEFLQEVLKAL